MSPGRKIDLYEVSVVAIPADAGAGVTRVKSIATIRAFQNFLHQAGWSQSQAKALASHGWSCLELEDDEEDPDPLTFLRLANAQLTRR